MRKITFHETRYEKREKQKILSANITADFQFNAAILQVAEKWSLFIWLPINCKPILACTQQSRPLYKESQECDPYYVEEVRTKENPGRKGSWKEKKIVRIAYIELWVKWNGMSYIMFQAYKS